MNDVVPIEDAREDRRKAALVKAIGFDRLPSEQRELAYEYARKYELDLLLRHVVIVEGKPYVTRDALLHIAHRSGQLDGFDVTDPVLEEMPGQGIFWRARCTVWRKDMSRPISLMGRYPAKGGNQRFAPEMAVKVAEVMTLRRAFDISAPAFEERWDIDSQAPADDTPTVTERIAAKHAALTEPRRAEVGPDPAVMAAPAGEGGAATPSDAGAPAPLDGDRGRSDARRGATPAARAAAGGEAVTAAPSAPLAACGAVVPEPDALGIGEGGPCVLSGSHRVHRNAAGNTWPVQ